MPEGHSVHRIARQFALNFVDHRVAVSSPQGRFASGAAQLDGRTMSDAKAVGKQMFLEFDSSVWLRVHLGLYGAWDFAGDITADATVASAAGRMGQTNQRGTVDTFRTPDTAPLVANEFEDSLHSIGAPRRTRLRMAEQEVLRPVSAGEGDTFPPDPVGAVRVRLLTERAVADLRGPTACVVASEAEVDAVLDRLGPDPLVDVPEVGEERFVSRVSGRATPIGVLLMDQSVVAGIGNVYRAELLFRAGLNPHTPGSRLPTDVIRALWQDWSVLLQIGVETGQMLTMDGLSPTQLQAALANQADRHWVYKREGLPCRVCGTHILLEPMASRKLYWCPRCQA